MIVGLFVRNFKCYSNINFLSFIKDGHERLNVFIGENGIGKSSVLEAINCVMNQIHPKYWEITLGQKKDRSFIAPVFLIEKNQFSSVYEKELDAISSTFWNADLNSFNSSGSTSEFVIWRDYLKSKIDIDKYYLIVIGRNSENNILLTTSFHNKITASTRKDGVSKQKIQHIFHEILNWYSYIYIPVENKISDVLSLESEEMQGLMDKSVIEEIKSLLEQKNYKYKDSAKSNSIVQLINGNLNEYISEINDNLSSGYKFQAPGNVKKNISAMDIINAIFRVYFQIRILTKDGKNIHSLSSGQQRIALMDVATNLLTINSEKSKQIILAIDEPESSLQSSLRFEQFNRLVQITENYEHQVFLTTHWYGLLLKPSNGRLNFVSQGEASPEIKSFPMMNLFDHRRYFPDSIEMKSYFDLMSSMLSILKVSKSNWLICEGYEDAKYLNYFLSDMVSDLHILPFNGCGNLKKLFEFLSVPFSDSKDENPSIKGKVLFLADSDEANLLTVKGYKAGNYSNKLKFLRFSLDRDKDKVELISVASTNAVNTEIEDVLLADRVWSSLNSIAERNDEMKKYIENFSFDGAKKYSDLTKNITFLDKGENIDAYKSFEAFKNYLHTDEIKSELAKEYTKSSGDKNIPEWCNVIVDYFK